MTRIALVLSVVMVSTMAVAPTQAQQTTPERCALIGPATERLACYDSLFRSGQLTGGVQEEAENPTPGIWNFGVEVSQIDGTETAFATLQSQQLIPALPRGRAPARLTIICGNDDVTSVQFSFAGQFMGTETSNSGTITLQFDNNPPRSQSLQLSGDRTALGFFSNDDAMAFISQLQQTQRLLVRAQPQAQRSATVSFDLEGIGEALEPVREACGW